MYIKKHIFHSESNDDMPIISIAQTTHFVFQSALAPLRMLCAAKFGSNLLFFEQFVDLSLSD